MIDYFHYKALNSALVMLQLDQEYIIIRHMLLAGKKVRLHRHPKANEWLVIGKQSDGTAGFVVTIGEKSQKFLITEGEVVIDFPKNTMHSIEAITDIAYFVVRDKKDKTVYSR